MAYVGNQLSTISQTIEGNFNIYCYFSATDSLATVLGANYISDGLMRGMENGNFVLLVLGALTAPSLYLAQVSANQGGGAAGNGVTLSGIGLGAATAALPPAQYKTAALQSATIVAANMAGAAFSVFDNTGTTPANLATDTAANIIAAVPGWQIGQSYVLRIRNDSGSANTATITAGTGVTLTGTMTIAQYVARDFMVTYTAAGAVTLQNIGDSAAAS